MNINENYSLSVNAPSIVDAKKLDRSFAPTDINGANDVNEVLSQLNVGEYSQESIDNVCKGYSLIRDDYGNPLSIVSSTYDLLQPIEAFGFLDTLQDELGFAYDKASFTNGGRKLNITAKCGTFEVEQNAPRKKGDVIGKRIIASTSFDGTSATSIRIQLLRVWCSNGMANWIDDKASRIIVRHTKNQRKIMANALEQATGIKQAFQYLHEDINVLRNTRINEKQVTCVLHNYFGIDDIATAQDRVQQKVKDIRNQFDNEKLGTFGETAYDLLNAFTAWNTHFRNYRETRSNKTTKSVEENRYNAIGNSNELKKFRNEIMHQVGY